MRRRIGLLLAAGLVAVLGVALVLSYVKGATGTAVAADEGTVPVLTATALIETGETAAHAQAEGKLALVDVPPASVVGGAVTAVDSMVDEVALAPIYPGEQILAARFGTSAQASQTLPVPRGMVAASVELSDPGRVAGFVTPGSHVAIFLSYQNTGNDASLPPSFTRILVSNAEVIAVGATTIVTPAGQGGGDGEGDAVPSTILTVALDQHDVDRVLFASTTGGLAFGLIGPGTTITPDKGVTVQDLLR